MEKQKKECILEELAKEYPLRSVNELLYVCGCKKCKEQQR